MYLPVGYYKIGSMYRFEQKGQSKTNDRATVFTMTDLHVNFLQHITEIEKT